MCFCKNKQPAAMLFGGAALGWRSFGVAQRFSAAVQAVKLAGLQPLRDLVHHEFAKCWLHEHGLEFAWQEGYGAFSVSPSNRDAVKDYIEHQAELHRERSYENEFEAMLRKSGSSSIRRMRLGGVPSLRGSLHLRRPTRHYRAGLSYAATSALGRR
jgi:hypothetical protein